MYEFDRYTSIEEFGYEFTVAGELRSKEAGEPFNFVVKSDDPEYNQKHYEAIGEIVTEEVYKLLTTRGKLQKTFLNEDQNSFVFSSEDYAAKDVLVCLIHGSGVVRAGQWARRLIINNDLDKGTQLPFIEHYLGLGCGVVVFNTNQNTVQIDGGTVCIQGSENPEEHAETVWNKLVSKTSAKTIIVIAHSYGGEVTVTLAKRMKKDFLERVSGVFLTDSVHFGLTGHDELDTKLKAVGVNYVSSDQPLGEVLTDSRTDIRRVSAGHPKHEWTSWSAMKSIFDETDKIVASTPGKQS